MNYLVVCRYVKRISVRMSVFYERLREERKKLGLNQADFAALGRVTVDSQGNYERGLRKPDSAYLEAIALEGVDVGYLLTGVRTSVGMVKTTGKSEVAGVRQLTQEEAALLDNYNAADEQGRAAARRVLDALAQPQPKRANG